LNTILKSPIFATAPAHITLSGFIILIIFRDFVISVIIVQNIGYYK
jgi:hypothetical protein